MSRLYPVLVIGDTHCPAMLAGYPAFLTQIHSKYACKTVVHIGDLIDLHSISYHENDPDCDSPSAELDKAIAQVALITKCFPKAHYLMGNHCSLIQRKATTAGLSSKMLKPLKDLLSLPKGWTVHPRYTKLMLDDHVIYQHGECGKQGQFAALQNAKSEFCSVVMGHLHSQAGVWYTANQKKAIFGMATGCGIDAGHMQMSYGVKFASKPVVSCGVVVSPTEAYVELMKLT